MWGIPSFIPATRGSISRFPLGKGILSLGFKTTGPIQSFTTMMYDCGGRHPNRLMHPNLGYPYRYNFAGYGQLQQPIHRRCFVVDANSTGTSPQSSGTDISEEIQIPGAQQGGKKLAIIFTCVHCNTRSAKQFTERSYRHGVVIATCPGCKRRHLIADNLGYFSDEDGGWDIEKGMAKLGENVRVATNDDVFELTVEDIYTKQVIEAAIDNATGDSD